MAAPKNPQTGPNPKKAPKRNRTKPTDPLFEEVRDKIQASQIVNRLEHHILGTLDTNNMKVELSPTQVAAARILLDKRLPNLQSTEVKAKVETEQPWIGPKPLTEDDWQAKHGKETEH